MSPLLKKTTSTSPVNTVEANPIEAITKYFVSEKTLLGVREPTIKAIASTIAAFAAADSTTTLSRRYAGEIYHKFLQLPIVAQATFTKKWADAIGVPAPDYPDTTGKAGRPTTGRNQLVQIVYAKQPRMTAIIAGQRDTLGGKNVTSAIREYLRITEQIAPRAARSTIVAYRRGFKALLSVAETQEEIDVLNELATRAGVDAGTLKKWHNEVERELAAETAVEAEVETPVEPPVKEIHTATRRGRAPRVPAMA